MISHAIHHYRSGGTLAQAMHEGAAQARQDRSDSAIVNPLRSQHPVLLVSPWAWFVVCGGFSFLFNSGLLLDSRYAELAAHGVIAASAVLAGRFVARRFSDIAIRFITSPRRAAVGYANGIIVAATIAGACVGALVGFQAATLYTREMLSAGANHTAALEQQREWLEKKTKTNLIRPDQPYHLGIPSFLYVGLR